MQHFGFTIDETAKALRGPQLGRPENAKAKTRIIFSAVLLFFSIFLILKKDIIGGEDTSKIGEFIIGSIVGYWLR